MRTAFLSGTETFAPLVGLSRKRVDDVSAGHGAWLNLETIVNKKLHRVFF
jgi:hypothetical protein